MDVIQRSKLFNAFSNDVRDAMIFHNFAYHIHHYSVLVDDYKKFPSLEDNFMIISKYMIPGDD